MRNQYIECSCTSNEHTLRFTYFEDDKDFLYVTTFLETGGFWKRLWYGIKYIFGYKCKYGHFGETILDTKKVEELRSLCEDFLKEI